MRFEFGCVKKGLRRNRSLSQVVPYNACCESGFEGY